MYFVVYVLARATLWEKGERRGERERGRWLNPYCVRTHYILYLGGFPVQEDTYTSLQL